MNGRILTFPRVDAPRDGARPVQLLACEPLVEEFGEAAPYGVEDPGHGCLPAPGLRHLGSALVDLGADVLDLQIEIPQLLVLMRWLGNQDASRLTGSPSQLAVHNSAPCPSGLQDRISKGVLQVRGVKVERLGHP